MKERTHTTTSMISSELCFLHVLWAWTFCGIASRSSKGELRSAIPKSSPQSRPDLHGGRDASDYLVSEQGALSLRQEERRHPPAENQERKHQTSKITVTRTTTTIHHLMCLFVGSMSEHTGAAHVMFPGNITFSDVPPTLIFRARSVLNLPLGVHSLYSLTR